MMTQTSGSVPTEPVALENAADFDDRVAEHDVVLVDFYADWCGPCQMMEPAVEAIAAETDAAVLKVDVDRHQGLAGEYGVQGIPTLLVFADGEVVDRMVGAQTEDALREAVAGRLE
jgi:thioredoxin 1